jgi:small subunit ribosomal protein S17
MNNRRRLIGVVKSNKMMKTVVVHSSQTVMAHDELGCQIGDEVQIVETRPLSAKKRWAVEQIMKHDIIAAEVGEGGEE